MNQQAAAGAGAELDAAAAAARGEIIDAGGAAANAIGDAGNLAQNNIFDASQNAQAGMSGAVQSANGTLADLHSQSTALTSPYTSAGSGAVGTLASYLAPGGEFNREFKFSQDDPGYQFRLDEGAKALQRSAAARGAVAGGGAMKAMTRYAQGVASDEYGKAFDRFQTERKNRFGMLADVAGMGQTSAGQQIAASNAYGTGVSNNTLRGAEFIGSTGTRAAESAGELGLRAATTAGGLRTNAANTAGTLAVNSATRRGDWTMDGVRGAGEALMGGANARAAGTVGSANAWSGAIAGVGNGVISGLATNKKFNPSGRTASSLRVN